MAIAKSAGYLITMRIRNTPFSRTVLHGEKKNNLFSPFYCLKRASVTTTVSLQTDDAGQVRAAALAHVACSVGLQTNDVRRN